MHAVIHAAQVGGQDAVPLVGSELVNRTAEATDAGIVDEDVAALSLKFHDAGGLLYRTKRRNIANEALGRARGGADGLYSSIKMRLRASADENISA